MGLTNADVFKRLFNGMFATELWSLPENSFLEWLNSDYNGGKRWHEMDDFLRFVDDLRRRFPIHVEIYYSKIMDWCIRVSKKGCASDYPTSDHIDDDAILADAQDCDMELAFAKAHVQLKEWLLEFDGGY